MPNKHSQRGFSLIEVLVAVLVVAIGLVGLAGMQLVGLKSNQQSFSKNQAAHHTQAILERMRGNPVGVFDGNYVINSTSMNCGAAPAVNCTEASSSCSVAEIAKYDIHQAFCGSTNSSSGGIKRDLSNSKLIITCPVDCANSVTIDITWQEQVLGKESAGSNVVPRQLTLNTRIGK